MRRWPHSRCSAITGSAPARRSASRWRPPPVGAVHKALAGGPVPKPAGSPIALRIVDIAAARPGGAAGTGLLAGLERDPAIYRITLISGATVTVNHVAVQALAAGAPRARCYCRPPTAGFRVGVTSSRGAARSAGSGWWGWCSSSVTSGRGDLAPARP